MKKYYLISLAVLIIGLGIVGSFYTDSLSGNLRNARSVEGGAVQEMGGNRDVSSEAVKTETETFPNIQRDGETTTITVTREGKTVSATDGEGETVYCDSDLSNLECASYACDRELCD